MKFWKLALATTFLILSHSANAALVGRLAATEGGTDYQAYYDDIANLTWLSDANAAGIAMNWADANSWAAGLTVDGVDGWRLANSDTCSGYNCTGSEMGNMFYNVLGNTAGSLSNTGPFSNVQSSAYWMAVEYVPNTSESWFYGMDSGYQAHYDKEGVFYAWAVQSGDITAVPVPAAAWLFGSGLIGLAGFAKRKKS